MDRAYTAKIVFCLTLTILLSLGTQAFTDTECLEDPTEPCQKPYYTDDQNQYLYDLRASWILSSGPPSQNSPTILHGGLLRHNHADHESDTVESDTKTEWYIENPGEAEDGAQDEFGRGTIESRDVSFINPLSSSDSLVRLQS